MPVLAQAPADQVTITVPAGPPTTRPVADPSWADRAGRDYAAGAVTLVVATVAMLVAYGVLRRALARVRLTAAFVVAGVAVGLFAAVATVNPAPLLAGSDLVGWWAWRLLAAALVFAGLRALDRLVFVPVLTRGGRVPPSRFVQQICNTVAVVFAVLTYGSWAFDWDIDKFLAGSAVVSIVLGLALQETLGNFFSGMVMQASSPFAIGDWITCAGVEGKVVDMTWRAVTVETVDANYVLIPNSVIAREQIVNYNSPTTRTVRTVAVHLEYDAPPNGAVDALLTAARETPGVLAAPAPQVLLTSFDAGAVLYHVRFWIDQPFRHLEVEHQVRANCWYRCRQRGYGQLQTTDLVDLLRKQRQDAPGSVERRLRAIAAVPLFAPLAAEHRLQLARDAGDVVLGAGQVLFRQDDPGDRFYIVRHGRVDVLVRPPAGGAEVAVAALGDGEFFGEMSALTGQPRTATIRAVVDTALVEIDKNDLRRLFETDATVMEKLGEVIARRNADRDAAVQGAAAAAAAPVEVVAQKKRSLLDRMTIFFGIGTTARA